MKNKKAFSLIELSVVILIIGILVAGITQSSRLIEQFRLSSARSLTEGSDVNSIKGLTVWLETSLERSFDDTIENNDSVGTGGGSTSWNDINPQSSTKSNTSSTVGPAFIQRCINNINCLRFDGAAQFLDTAVNNGFSQGASVFVVFRVNTLPTGGALQSLLAVNGVTHTAGNSSFQLNVTDDSDLQYSFFDSGGTAVDLRAGGGTSVISAGVVYIGDFVDNGNQQEVSVSVNGNMDRNLITGTSETKNMSVGFNIGSFTNGTRAQFFNGDIVELIIFNRGLKNEERDAVENYLSKKWGVNI